jgi:PAT family beta-lactamase induction signal transducer AmpG
VALSGDRQHLGTLDSRGLPPKRTHLFAGAVAAALYFSEGLPYGIVTDLLPLYLRVHHVALTAIGSLSTVGLAWTLKVLWSPLVDSFGTYRRWIAGAVLAIAACLAALAAAPDSIGSRFWIIVSLLVIASATQDIAADAFTIRATPPEMIGPVNSIRVMAYRAAIIAGGGGLAAVAGWMGWRSAFAAGAAAAGAIFLLALALPDDRGERSERRNLLRDLAGWFTRPRAGILLAIVFLYRLGELAVITMIKPYWVDRGYSPAEIGTITTVIGVTVSVVGAVLGGAIVAKFGLYRALLSLGIAQTASNLGYALVATTNAGRWAIYAASIVENLGYGLGTAAFLAFLMSICDRERAATEYAMLTAAFGLTRALIGPVSGYLAQSAGYTAFFWSTVFFGIPALFLLPAARPAIES